MYLHRLDTRKPDFEKLQGMLEAMNSLLDGRDSNISLEELLSFQGDDGSFSLFESGDMPNEAVVDFTNTPTYIASAVLMKEYLNGNEAVKKPLQKGLAFTVKTGFRGHGYDALGTEINSLNIFVRGGLRQFLIEERELCPSFNCLVLNRLHGYNSGLKKGHTQGPLGVDYRKDWQMLTAGLKMTRRLYIAYGSNMNQEQMAIRCPDAQVVASSHLRDWQLKMPHVANIEPRQGGRVPVLIWEISDEDERKLDRYEGYPRFYDKRELMVNVKGKMVAALVYVMTDSHKNRLDKKAGPDYEEKIKKGYIDAGFAVSEYHPDR